MTRRFIPHSQPFIGSEEIEACNRVLDSRMLAKGKLVDEFEKKFASLTGYSQAVSTTSGTSALLFLLQSLNIGKGHEVIVPIYACSSIANAVRSVGATPVFSDSSLYWCSTFEDIAKLCTKRTRAIVLVHMYGIDASHDRFDSLDIPIIEDLSHAIGLERRYRSCYELAFTSLNATKCLTTGEGGMALYSVNSKNALDASSSNQVFFNKFNRMNDLSATIGLSQLNKYNTMLERRRAIARIYLEELHDISLDINDMRLLFHRDSNDRRSSIFFRFLATINGDVPEVIEYFAREHNISLRRGVDAMESQSRARFPNAIDLFESTLSIPIYPSLSFRDTRRIARALKGYFGA